MPQHFHANAKLKNVVSNDLRYQISNVIARRWQRPPIKLWRGNVDEFAVDSPILLRISQEMTGTVRIVSHTDVSVSWVGSVQVVCLTWQICEK